MKGSIVYFSGMLLLILGWSFFGMIIQVLGFFLIFRSFLPELYEHLCRTPFIGKYLSRISHKIESYYIQNLLDSLAGNQRERI